MAVIDAIVGDDLSPTAWQRTAAGTAAIEEGSL